VALEPEEIADLHEEAVARAVQAPEAAVLRVLVRTPVPGEEDRARVRLVREEPVHAETDLLEAEGPLVLAGRVLDDDRQLRARVVAEVVLEARVVLADHPEED